MGNELERKDEGMRTSDPGRIPVADLMRLLRAEGYTVKPWTLRYAARRRRIPRPRVMATGDQGWSAVDLPAIRLYLQNLRLGRPRKVVP